MSKNSGPGHDIKTNPFPLTIAAAWKNSEILSEEVIRKIS
jgi:hypothetical protein